MDDETIKIQIELKNFMQAMSQIKQVAQAVRQIPGATGGGGGGRPLGAGGGGGGRGGGVGVPPGMPGMLMRMFNRSRVGFGGGAGGGRMLMPLGRDLAAMFGPQTAIAAVIGSQLVHAAVDASKALFEMTKEVAQAGVAFARMQAMSGGTAGQSAFLSSFNSLIGQDMNVLANALAHELSAGGFMTGMGPSMGLRPDVGFMGDTNRANNMETLINTVRQMSDRQFQQMAFISPVIQALLPMRLISQQRVNRNFDIGKNITAPIHDLQFQKDAAEFVVALGSLSEAFNNFVTTAIKPFLPEITGFLDMLTDAFNKMALWINEHERWFKGITEIFAGLALGPMGMPMVGKGFVDMATPRKVTDAHTNAMEHHTDALNSAALREGTFGGGERARSAIPSKWGGINTRFYIGQSKMLGAFNL